MISESEQVEVSANALQQLLANRQDDKEKYAREICQLNAIIKAKETEIDAYETALKKMSLNKKSNSSHKSENSKKIIEELDKTRKFEKWFIENKDKLIEEEYNKSHKAEVEALRNRLSKLYDD